ncbi:MAG: methenyltetrahydrofolate cyclohydrolase [Anaerolineae bacterium]
MLADKTLRSFLDELASSAPAPGGGSVAALSGALGAALVSMVCNLTVGKKKYEAVQEEVAALLERSEALRHRLTALLDEDVRAYTAVSQAYKMPRETEDQKQAREQAIQKALQEATLVPMQVAEACVEVLDLCLPTAEKGNVNAVSDAGVAALAAAPGLRSAALNVRIHVTLIQDEAFVRGQRAKLDSLLAGKPELKERVYQLAVEKLPH